MCVTIIFLIEFDWNFQLLKKLQFCYILLLEIGNFLILNNSIVIIIYIISHIRILFFSLFQLFNFKIILMYCMYIRLMVRDYLASILSGECMMGMTA